MKVLITDDEALARERLRRLLAEIGGIEVANIEVVGEAASGGEALELAARLQPDVVLLDIRMPGIDGIEAALHLCAQEPSPAVVFTTAYGDHALSAFEANAVDYLLKPIRKQRLKQALEKAATLRRAHLQAVRDSSGSGPRTHICVRGAGSLRLIPLADVIWFQADQKYVSVRHRNGTVLIDESLVALEREFADAFVRVHRNMLVATRLITGLHKLSDGASQLMLSACQEQPEVSRRHLAQVRALIAARG
ncbi:MAG: LytTR family DNA-binding domain-containing protein [Chromatiales bacterium]|jgi:two-component system response regulator AlgR|nr:LytTR family DNA-binding domain-containing protein [Chromatiales bacterium]